MALQALLLSKDPEVHRTLRRVLDAANIDLDLSNNTDQARHILLRRKYDALLVDCDDMPNGPLVLRELRQGKLKHLDYDPQHQTLKWRKPKADQEEDVLQHSFYDKLSAQGISAPIPHSVRCGSLSDLRPTLGMPGMRLCAKA